MTDLLIYADTQRSATLRHEVPVSIGDPFLYIERDGRTIILTSSLELERIAHVLPDAELLTSAALGVEELIEQGLSWATIELHVATRAVRHAGVTRAAVPPDFPLGIADHLREEGIELVVDTELFERRRRVKNAAELAGIRRAQLAAEAGMRAAARLLARADIVGDGLQVDGVPLTAEHVRETIRAATAELCAPSPSDIMVTTAWSGGGHDPGTGPLPANLPIVIDLWPCDEATGCWADMTRTFVIGDTSEQVRMAERVAREALEAARRAVRPGVTGLELYDIACDVIEAAGYPTQRTTAPGVVLTHGFYFSLGHGVGLELHEAPGLGRASRSDVLVAGDVLALEPGIEGMAWGGVRFEDLVLVTADGCETLTSYSYGLTPEP